MLIIKIKIIENETTIKEISKKIGVTEKTLSNWINGKIPENIMSFLKLCKILDIKLEELI